MEEREGRSLAETPTWTVSCVTCVMVVLGFFFNGSLERVGKWLDKTKRKSLIAALQKIKEELMLFGVMSLLMSHFIIIVAKVCVKSSVMSSRFFPCASENEFLNAVEHVLVPSSGNLNSSVSSVQVKAGSQHGYCPEGHESFASQQSLEQLHRLMFVLGITHVFYSFVAIVLAMIKIYSWRVWENEAKDIAIQTLEDTAEGRPGIQRMRRLSTFIFHHASHPWSQHRVLVWLLCFSRQFWSSINRSSYMALRFGFITTHQLPLSYDFHNYMIRSMEEEFRDIVGISLPLWIYTICCAVLDFHGSNLYFWLSFLPAILILLIGTKLHRIVVKLAVEIMEESPYMKNHQFKLRDELFWFKKPWLLLRAIQLISFQNALEMATFIWSLWEIKEPSCFMDNRTFLVIRLTFGVVTQFWCSFITFPLYVIITQMGSRFKKSVVSENVRNSLHGWTRRVKARQSTSSTATTQLLKTSTSSDSIVDETRKLESSASNSSERSSFKKQNTSFRHLQSGDEKLETPLSVGPVYDSYSDDNEGDYHHDDHSNIKDELALLPP
ncbi:MLO-like protein 4 [Pyrus communis]|uniref:MLO-like protein 4 n=1 Tax=Pyrus communis TaxID=23211 RepID=UPI0035BF1DC1